jgi:probable rRNA maturation factor
MIRMMLSDRRFNLDKRRLKSLARAVMKNESASGKDLNVIYCTDNLIKDLNSRYLNKNHTTDVLAFELEDRNDDGHLLGEIYVNLQQARRQALENKINYNEEVRRLTVHGILHLLGYDDRGAASRKKMWNRQESYLNKWKK